MLEDYGRMNEDCVGGVKSCLAYLDKTDQMQQQVYVKTVGKKIVSA